MIKSQLATETRVPGIDAKVVAKVTDALFIKMRETLSKGEDIVIKDFGTFKVKPTAARTGRNPHTGVVLNIPPGRAVKFTAAATIKAALKG